jgi:dephospho-CoA kinase
MYLVGLTGGIASGKSYVASLLEELGASTIDADVVAREVVVPGTIGFSQVVDEFGKQFLQPTGEIDRQLLGEMIFSDPTKRARLESILHPLIKQRALQLISEQKSEIVVYVVPLLIEAAVDYPFDAVVTVEAGEANQVSRLMNSRGLSEEDARLRISAQTGSERRIARANYVIDSSGTKEQTKAQVTSVWTKIVAAARKGL